MEDNETRTATETREDENGGAEMRDNGDGRQGQRTAADEHGGEDVGQHV